MKYTFTVETNSFPEAHWLQNYIYQLQSELDKSKLSDPKKYDRYLIVEFSQVEDSITPSVS